MALLLLGLVSIAAGVALREFAVLAVPFVGGGILIVAEALHMLFTGRIH